MGIDGNKASIGRFCVLSIDLLQFALIMASSSAGDAALRPLQRAMKLANRAIQLDTGSQHQAAYVEYLKSVSYISEFLLEEAEQKAGCDIVTSDSQKMLKLAEQCLERARTTAGKLGKTEAAHTSLTRRISNVPDPPPTEASSTTPVVSKPLRSPAGRALGHRRVRSDEAQKLSPFPPPAVFQMMRANESQTFKKELTPLEEASIQNEKLRATYRARLSRLNPKQASQKTSLTLSLQRQMMENLVIAKAREETLQRKALERKQRLQEESKRWFFKNRKPSPEEEEQQVIYTAILEYEQDHEWSKSYKNKIKSSPTDTELISSYMYQVLSSHDHPITKVLKDLQCQIYNRLYPAISKVPARSGSVLKLCHRSLPTDGTSLTASGSHQLKTSQSLNSIPSIQRPSIQHSLSFGEEHESWGLSMEDQEKKDLEDNEMESSFEDLETFLSTPEGQKLTATDNLNTIVKEIHNALDELVSLSILSLDISDSTLAKDAFLDCIEESFFPELYPAMIALYRQVYGSREESLLDTMEAYSSAHPSVLGVPPKLIPRNVKDPYRAAVEELEILPDLLSPQRKMDCIVRTLRVICECAEEYSANPGAPSIGADYLLPLLVYVVLKSQMSHLLSECAALEEFIHEGYLIGEEGYCLTSLQSALACLEQMPNPMIPIT
ncbi:VPS9 domain-containing protein 1 [Pelodytes ibericus]